MDIPCCSCSFDCLPIAKTVVLWSGCISFVVFMLFMCGCFSIIVFLKLFCIFYWSLLYLLFYVGYNLPILKWFDLVGEIFDASGCSLTALI